MNRVAIEKHFDFLSAVAYMDGDYPQSWVAFVIKRELRLRQCEALCMSSNPNLWKARLPDPRIHKATYWYYWATVSFDDVFNGIPKVVCLRVAVRMRTQIMANACLKTLWPNELFQHAQQRAALLIREYVEHAICISRRVHRELNGTCVV